VKELLEGLQIDTERRSPVPVRRSRALPRRTLLTVPALLAAPLALGAWYAASSRPAAVEVFTVPSAAGPGAPAPTLTAGGYVRAARVVYVAPRVSGRLASLSVKEGDEVQAGDLIAEIDSRDLEQETAEARANYELAQASLSKMQAGSRPEEIAEARARVQAVARATQKAEREAARCSRRVLCPRRPSTRPGRSIRSGRGTWRPRVRFWPGWRPARGERTSPPPVPG